MNGKLLNTDGSDIVVIVNEKNNKINFKNDISNVFVLSFENTTRIVIKI